MSHQTEQFISVKGQKSTPEYFWFGQNVIKMSRQEKRSIVTRRLPVQSVEILFKSEAEVENEKA